MIRNKQWMLLLVAMLSTFSLSAQGGEREDRGYIVKVGQMAPDFTMVLEDGKRVKLSDMRGKVVMLQFTASWCGVCRKEMPFIERDIWLKYKDRKDFVLWGIDRDEPLEKVALLRSVTKVTYPIGLDPKGAIFNLYASPNAGITRNVIIDAEGRIAFLTRLYNEEEFQAMCQEIRRLLNKK